MFRAIFAKGDISKYRCDGDNTDDATLTVHRLCRRRVLRAIPDRRNHRGRRLDLRATGHLGRHHGHRVLVIYRRRRTCLLLV